RSVFTTIARRSGIVNSTPRMPPDAQIRNDSQNGNSTHHPTIRRPGSTKMIADNVPAADATVCTMLFSRIVEFLNADSTAIEITAAGIEVAKVRPTRRPRYTLAAVNTSVINTPRITPLSVSSNIGLDGEDMNATPGLRARASPFCAHKKRGRGFVSPS